MSDLILFWHRRDLRISDNTGIAAALEKTRKVVGVFCLDPNILKGDDVAPARVTYMIGCLQKLQERYSQMGSQLLILWDNPGKAIPKLATALQAKAVFWNWDVEPYSQQRDAGVIGALQEQGIEYLDKNWDQILKTPEEIRTGSDNPYTVYTPFWKNWISKSKDSPVEIAGKFEGLTVKEQETATEAGAVELPTAKDLGFNWDGELIIEPGEEAAQDRLEEFCYSNINEYQEQRNFPAIDGTSRLSAALKFGVIGIR
ncbi:MAG: deoxyribodipyrimidine photo-lyase, partial [Cyanobacteria bacterium P01_C01_bin.38]